MKSCTLITSFTLLTFLVLHCADMSISGNGGSSETVNAKVIISDTVAALTDYQGNGSGLIMEVFSTDYRPYEKSGFRTKTEKGKDAGAVALPSGGMYNFHIYSEEKKLSCFITNRRIKNGTADTLTCTLLSECIVDGKLVSGNEIVSDKRYVLSVPGSPFICISDEKQQFTFGAIPRGSFSLAVRPKEQRLLIAQAKYVFKIDEISERTRLDIVLP